MTGTALIVGASRGLGLGLVRELLGRGWQVTGTERAAKPSDALRALREANPAALTVEPLDIVLPEEIGALRQRRRGPALDLLFVNAGIAPAHTQTIGEVSTEDWDAILRTNALGPMRVIETLADVLAPDATVAVMSSGLGSVANNTSGGWETYRASKAALNMMLRSLAARDRGGRTYLAVSPGWVRTDMGGSSAAIDVETSTRGIADVLEQHRGRGGVAFVDYRGQTVAW